MELGMDEEDWIVAQIVLGVGTSHSPQVSTPWEHWSLLAQRDKGNPNLLAADGVMRSYDEMLDLAPSGIEHEITPEKWQARWEACQAAISRLAATVEEVQPDVIVAIGDDQHEMFKDDNMPAMGIYWGETVPNVPHRQDSPIPAVKLARWAYEGDQAMPLPGHPDLGLHLLNSLLDENFDLSHAKYRPEGKGIGHAWGFLQRRILNDRPVPMVPIMLNTYYEPNQPRVGRCVELGQALRRAIESWDSNARVAIMASGGLSHFVVLEDFDQTVINALQENDFDTLTNIPEKMFKSGTSETKNWIAAGAALEGLQMKLVDYAPCYRTPAGTGCGMTFAQWA
jgi:hypothetical protein